MSLTHLVVGAGEVGSALAVILGCDRRDIEPGQTAEAHYDVIHICFPWSDAFPEQVRAYVQEHSARHVLVHSTVPAGTCDGHGWNFSPVTGQHPDLVESIHTFVKPVGGPDAEVLADELEGSGMTCTTMTRACDLEAGKLLDLAIYGTQVAIEKAAWDWCQRQDVDYGVAYTDAGHRYNDGYRILGLDQYIRPVLEHMPGPIGGHCVAQNVPLMDDPWFAGVIDHANALGYAELRDKTA